MAKNKSQYDSTLNLPKTLFEMRAGLPKKEPVMLKDWDDNDLYNQLMKHNEGKPQFILHDGPPYANGNIHMGTALNKIIKDIIIREKNMEGFQAPYVPGFDTHGLPIELKALSSLGEKKKDISKLELRQICEKFATEHIDIMSDQFKRLGVIGDFEHPYLTLKPEFEARQIEIFGEMAKKGYIYKGMKAVYWCPEDRTALAEAEIEYAEDECDSIYVRFKLTDDPNGVLAKYGIPLTEDEARFMAKRKQEEEANAKARVEAAQREREQREKDRIRRTDSYGYVVKDPEDIVVRTDKDGNEIRVAFTNLFLFYFQDVEGFDLSSSIWNDFRYESCDSTLISRYEAFCKALKVRAMKQPVHDRFLAKLTAKDAFYLFKYAEKSVIAPLDKEAVLTRKQISDLCVSYAKKLGLRCRQEPCNNVVIWKKL